MSEPHLLVERDGHIVTVTMNRPERKNAFSTEMLVRAYDAWQMINDDPEVRVAILTGAGGDFC
ncbi:MAG: enoyl-CoA hydratase, partial [Actinomycetota bacterium]